MGNNQLSASDSDVFESETENQEQELQKVISAQEMAKYQKVIKSKLSELSCFGSIPALVLNDLMSNLFLKDSIRKYYFSSAPEGTIEYLGSLLTIYETNDKNQHNFYRNVKLNQYVTEIKEKQKIPNDKILKVRFVLIQTPKDYSDLNLFDLLSPVLDNFSSLSPSQAFKLADNDENFENQPISDIQLTPAIAIGPFLLYYNQMGLVIPKRVVGEASFVLSEIEPFACIYLNDEAFHRLSTIVFDWNINARYSVQTNNAQHFVDSLATLFKISLGDNTTLAEYLKIVRSNGFGNCTIPFSEQFREQFKVKKSEKTFTDRNELLTFTSKLVQRKFSKDVFPNEWKLFHNFERVYWSEMVQRDKYLTLALKAKDIKRSSVDNSGRHSISSNNLDENIFGDGSKLFSQLPSIHDWF